MMFKSKVEQSKALLRYLVRYSWTRIPSVELGELGGMCGARQLGSGIPLFGRENSSYTTQRYGPQGSGKRSTEIHSCPARTSARE